MISELQLDLHGSSAERMANHMRNLEKLDWHNAWTDVLDVDNFAQNNFKSLCLTFASYVSEREKERED